MTPAQKELRKHASSAHRKTSEMFFKTGPGQYSHGDQFIGVKTPHLRVVAKSFSTLPLPELQILLDSLVHEDRALALMILRLQYERATEEESLSKQRQLFNFFWKNRARVNNWDLVDGSAPYISGHFAYIDAAAKAKVFGLIRSRSLWDRRIAMVSTYYFIRQEEFKPVIEMAQALLNDQEDLMHKASGWMLREMGKREVRLLREFLEHHGKNMPRTMLRYAIEKFPEAERLKYLRA